MITLDRLEESSVIVRELKRTENGGSVVGGGGEQRGRVERVRERDEPVPREKAGGRLEAHEAAVRRRVAHRAARVGAKCTARAKSRE